MKIHTTFAVEITVESASEHDAEAALRDYLSRAGTARPLAREITDIRFVSARPYFTFAEERAMDAAQARYDSEA